MAIGEKISFKGQTATVRFVGKTQFSPGNWVGLELETPSGKNDGSIQGVQYFKCTRDGNYGVFVRPTLLDKTSLAVPIDTLAAGDDLLTANTLAANSNKTGANIGSLAPNDVASDSFDVKAASHIAGSRSGTVGAVSTPNIVSVVHRLQQKLQNAQNENRNLRESTDLITRKLEITKNDLQKTELLLEAATVESEYLKDENDSLAKRLDQILKVYEDLSVDYALLKEELEIYKELEDAVRLQPLLEEHVSIEDFSVLMQLNKRLELANTSLQELMVTKENQFNSDIDCLKNELAQATRSVVSQEKTLNQLKLAEASIKHLQDQLEMSMELVSIVEHLTNENEALNLKITDLEFQVDQLSELNEIERALEDEHLKREKELRDNLALLDKELKLEKKSVADLMESNMKLKKQLSNSLFEVSKPTNNTEVEQLSYDLEQLRLKNESLSQEKTVASTEISFLKRFWSNLIPKKYSSTFQALYGYCLTKQELATRDCPQHVLRFCWLEFKDTVALATLALKYDFARTDSLALLSTHESIVALIANHSALAEENQFLMQLLELQNMLVPKLSEWLDTIWNFMRVMSKVLALYDSIEEIVESEVDMDEGQQSMKKIHRFSKEIKDVLGGLKMGNSFVGIHDLKSDDLNIPNDVTSLTKASSEELVGALESISQLIKRNIATIFEEPETIYSLVNDDNSQNLKGSLETLQNQLSEKQSVIQDLQLHVGLLEKNMNVSLAEKDTEIELDRGLILKAEGEIADLQKQLKEIRKQNEELEQQLDIFFDSDKIQGYQQTKFFKDKTAKLEATLTESLMEEIQLLKGILKPQLEKTRWDKRLDWLSQPLCRFKSSQVKSGMFFLSEAHQKRKSIQKLIKTIPRATANSPSLRYRRFQA